jgi:hypothetical protein
MGAGISMEEETIIPAPPTPPTMSPPAETPVRRLPMDEASKLIRKTSERHAELFRRLAD